MDEDEVGCIDTLMLIFRMLSLAADFAVAYFAILIFDGVVCAANFYYLYDILKKQTVFVRDGGDPIGRVV